MCLLVIGWVLFSSSIAAICGPYPCGGNTFGGLFIAAFVRSPFYLCGLSAWLAWLPLAHIVLYVLEFGLWILGSGLSCFVFY
jgi:hypothetical protein